MERLLLLFVFFASGVAALLYQTIWQRMLALFGGADVYSATIIVAAFMTGLGFGSLAGGHLADRLDARRRIFAFAGAEFAVAAFAALSPWIFYDLLYGQLGTLNLSRTSMAAIVFLVTLWPTFFMGMSLPLISRMLATAEHPARWIALLYGFNTIGAACGSAVAMTVLFRHFDFVTSLRVGAVLSLACGTVALAAAPRLLRAGTQNGAGRGPTQNVAAEVTPGGEPSSHATAADTTLPVAVWVAVYALSGFVALSLEIVWFRVLGVVLKSNAFTFGYLLAIYLGGLGLGALLAHHPRIRRLRPASAFFLLQTAVPVWAGASLALLVYSVERIGLGDPLWQFMASPFPSARRELLMIVPFVLIVPSTVFMGISFGLLQRTVQTELRTLGRRLGWLQTANIVGSAAGAMITGLVLIEWLGSATTMRVLVGSGVVFLLLYFHITPDRRRWTSLAAATALAVTVLTFPDNALLWSRLHVSQPDRVVFGEDATGLVLLRQTDMRRTDVFLGGFSQSWLPYGGIHTALGALPALIHPAPRRVAVIGLASGDTAFSIGGRRETQIIDSIEIVRPQLDVLQRLDRLGTYPALRSLLNDPRVTHHFTDARAYLRRSTARWDIIEADALIPRSAGAGNLYSVEYFQLLREKLTPGGFAVTWIPTSRTLASLLYVFPHVLTFRDIAIGSTEPISFDPAAIRARLDNDETKRYYAAGDIDLEAVLAPMLAESPAEFGPSFDRSTLTDLNRDLFPRDEFGRLAAPADLSDNETGFP